MSYHESIEIFQGIYKNCNFLVEYACKTSSTGISRTDIQQQWNGGTQRNLEHMHMVDVSF